MKEEEEEEEVELEVVWFENDPSANRWKYFCKIFGHKWKPSHPHITMCDRCLMNGLERYKAGKEWKPE